MDANLNENIIIDTDCGIDDAMAIMLALSVNTSNVLAFTCCFGNSSVDNACKNVMRTLVVCNKKNIPVHRGCRGPLLRKTTDAVYDSSGLGGCGHEFSTDEMKEDETPAALALVQLVKQFPKKITLIAIGPLTNIALAYRIEPKFTEFLKQLVIMGGNYKGIGNITEVAEFNFYCDPESANIVLTEALCPTVLVPWETTVEFAIDWDMYDKLVQVDTKKGQFLNRISKFCAERRRKKGNKKYYDCDLLAVAAVLYPACVKSSMEKSVCVEYEGLYTRGLTILRKDDSTVPPVRNKIKIVTSFDISFLDELRYKMLL